MRWLYLIAAVSLMALSACYRWPSNEDGEGPQPPVSAKTIQQQKEEMTKEIAELEARHAAAREARAILQAIKLPRVRFFFVDGILGKEPRMGIHIINKTDIALSRIYFHGVVATPGRSVAWVEDDFNHSIRGGIEPGETQEWTLAPGPASEWCEVPQDRSDMVFTVEVVGADDASGHRVASVELSTFSEESRLHSLRQGLERFR